MGCCVAACCLWVSAASRQGNVLPLACSVIKIILQFCKENGLTESFNAIQVRARGGCTTNGSRRPLVLPGAACTQYFGCRRSLVFLCQQITPGRHMYLGAPCRQQNERGKVALCERPLPLR